GCRRRGQLRRGPEDPHARAASQAAPAAPRAAGAGARRHAPPPGAAPPRWPGAREAEGEPSLSRMRCFVALDLPDDVRWALDARQARWRAGPPRADVRGVAPAGLHLTLKFLGEVTDERRDAVRAALERVARRTAPIGLACAGLGVFPGPARPRVVWAGVTA